MSKASRFLGGGKSEHRPRVRIAKRLLLVLPLLSGQVPSTQAQVAVGIGIDMPGVSIAIDLPAYPDLLRVPGYPVYYAPQAPGNYFYYDGLYWVFLGRVQIGENDESVDVPFAFASLFAGIAGFMMLLKDIMGTSPSEGWTQHVFKVPTPHMHSLRHPRLECVCCAELALD